MKRVKRNTPAEEAIIQGGIATDTDAAEWTDEDFAQARHIADVLPARVVASLTPRRRTTSNKPVKAH